MKLFVVACAAALVSFVWFVVLVTYSPNLTYEEGFETECRSVVSGPSTGDGDSDDADLVSGERQYNFPASPYDGYIGPDTIGTIVDAGLVADCDAKRSQVLVRSQVAATVFVLSVVGAVARGRALPPRRRRSGSSGGSDGGSGDGGGWMPRARWGDGRP